VNEEHPPHCLINGAVATDAATGLVDIAASRTQKDCYDHAFLAERNKLGLNATLNVSWEGNMTDDALASAPWLGPFPSRNLALGPGGMNCMQNFLHCDVMKPFHANAAAYFAVRERGVLACGASVGCR
jgi:hypothetical protein